MVSKDPQEVYSLNYLSSITGLSKKKLQLGFKHLFGATVCEFIKNERLKKAELLLRTTELNISEVSYSVGITSRSYFCKIFKGKYACVPKDYKQMLSKLVIETNI